MIEEIALVRFGATTLRNEAVNLSIHDSEGLSNRLICSLKP